MEDLAAQAAAIHNQAPAASANPDPAAAHQLTTRAELERALAVEQQNELRRWQAQGSSTALHNYLFFSPFVLLVCLSICVVLHGALAVSSETTLPVNS